MTTKQVAIVTAAGRGMGAAIASIAVLAGTSILALVEVFYLLGLQPYSRESLKPVISGAIATAALLVLPRQGWIFFSLLFFVPAYLCLFWLLSSTNEKTWMRGAVLSMIKGTTRLLRTG